MLVNGNEYGKTKVMRISRQQSPIQIMTHQKHLENVEYFSCLSCMIIKGARCKREIKSRIALAKAAFNKKTFHQQIGFKLKEEIC